MALIDLWCVKWHMKLNPEKMKSMAVSWYRTNAFGYGDLSLGGAELEEVKSLHILGVTINCESTFMTHLREVVPKAARSLDVVRLYLIVYVCSRAVSMRMFCLAWNIMPRVDFVCRDSFGLPGYCYSHC